MYKNGWTVVSSVCSKGAVLCSWFLYLTTTTRCRRVRSVHKQCAPVQVEAVLRRKSTSARGLRSRDTFRPTPPLVLSLQ
uniref:Uncharacterized protein n=1 Tax=Ixodes scapularis TaxID=6945 RepID=A0A4D5S032_IXOSC